jgi:hypothetical protein
LANQATLATRNIRHFNDLSVAVVNPWETWPPAQHLAFQRLTDFIAYCPLPTASSSLSTYYLKNKC